MSDDQLNKTNIQKEKLEFTKKYQKLKNIHFSFEHPSSFQHWKKARLQSAIEGEGLLWKSLKEFWQVVQCYSIY